MPYRLAYWRVAGEEINYRRFFDINGLAAIRMEDAGGLRGGPRAHLPARWPRARSRPAHRPPRRAVRPHAPTSSGFRSATSSSRRRRLASAEHAASDARWPAVSEALCAPVARGGGGRPGLAAAPGALRGGGEDSGRPASASPTTGRSTAPPATTSPTRVTALFVDPREPSAASPTSTRRFIGEPAATSRSCVYEKKKLIMSGCHGERDQRARPRAEPHLGVNRRTRDFTLNSLRRALVGVHRLLPGLPDLRRRPAPGAGRARRALHRVDHRPRASGATPPPTRRIFDFLRGHPAARATRSTSTSAERAGDAALRHEAPAGDRAR